MTTDSFPVASRSGGSDGGRLERHQPSGSLSPVPRQVLILLPPDWHGKESWTVMSPLGDCNVMASSEPIDDSLQTLGYALEQGEMLLGRFPGYEELRFISFVFDDGRHGYLREFRWVPPDGEPVWQLQVYATDRGHGFLATGTASRADFPRHRETIMQVIAGIRFG